MTPFVGNYTPEQIEQARKDIAETSPAKIEQAYRMGKITLQDKLEMLRGYGQMKREIQIRDMSMPGDGGAFGEIKNYAIGVMKEGEKAWQAAKDLKAGKAVFHGLMAGLEGLKAFDIPGNIVERWALEAGIEPSYARAANWATWIPTNFVGISQTLRAPFKLAGAAVKAERKALKGVNEAADKYAKWLKDPVGEATKSAMKLTDQEAKQVLNPADQIKEGMQKIVDAVTGAEAKTGVQAGKSFDDFSRDFKTVWDEHLTELKAVERGDKPAFYSAIEDKAALAYAEKNSNLQVFKNITPDGDFIVVPKTPEGEFAGIRLKELSARREEVFKAGDELEIEDWNREFSTILGYDPELAGSIVGKSGQGPRDLEAQRIFQFTQQEQAALIDEAIPTPDEFEKGAMSQLIKFYEQKANAYIRRGVSHEATEAQAVGKMSFDELLNRPPEKAASAAELAYMGRVNDAIRRGMEATIEDALPHLDDIAAGKRPDLTGLFRAHFSAFAQTNPTFLGASGEVGRGLEFMKVLQPEVQAARIYDTVIKGLGSDMLAESGDAAIAKSLLKLSVLEKDARKAFLEGATKTDSPRLLNSLFKSLLFVVPSTHMANLAGQNQGALLQMAQYTGSALAGGPNTPALSQAVAMWKGYGSAWLHLPRIMRIASERSANSLDKLGLEGATDAVARYGPARWLGFGDELVSAALEQAHVNADAIGQGLQKGLKGKALADYANTLKSDLTAVKEMEEAAAPLVQHAMFHDPLGPLAAPIQKMAHDTLVDFWLPVVKFPINSLKAARDWTPGLQFLSGKFIDDVAAGGAREAEARTRTTLSWMFANYLWGEAKAGEFTGGGPLDPEKNAAWKAAGNVPYSLHGVPYRWFEPLGTMMGSVADMAYFSNQMEPDDVEDFAAGLGVTLSRMVENNWWLRSMEGVTGMVSAAHEAQKTTEFFKAAARFVGAPFITVATGGPLGGRIREIKDPEVKQINSFADYYLAKVPGYSKTVPPLLNYTGEPKTIPPVMGHRWLNLVLPSGLRGEGTKDPVGAFLHKHGLQLADRWKTFGGSDEERPFFEPGQGSISPVLTSDESHNWKLLSLTDVKRYDGLTWVEKIAELDADPAFQLKTRYQKQRQISALYNNYRDKGKKMLGSIDPVVAAKVEEAKQKTREMRGKVPADFGDNVDALPDEMDATPEAPEQPMIVEPIEQPAVEAPVQ